MKFGKLFFLLLICPLVFVACTGASNDNATPDAAPASSPVVAVETSPDNAATAAPPADVVRASGGRAEVRAGGAAEVEVRVRIAAGYHINANPPTHDYLRATKLELVAELDITAGEPAYPRALKKKFAFDPQPLAVYEQEAVIKLPLRVAADAARGERTLRARVNAQPCDDTTCYAPRTVETSIALTIK
ncbi:MAG TPA: protein-disulfide reductase DsbD domain-containing protein [Pyrinomonadaceae bacterium]|jgi:hypothetical protein|nr:protein-disulfide reductase DsbD domain-containing protein [Pyrinomonadaceae bacterium]